MEVESDNAKETTKRLVSVRLLAAETGYSHGIKRSLLSRGIKPFQLKRAQNAPYYISADEAEAFKKAVDDERRLIFKPSDKPLPQGLGGVYCVEVPSYEGRIRVKSVGEHDVLVVTYRPDRPSKRRRR